VEPHGGNGLKALLALQADIPLEFSRPEVVSILREYYRQLED
jgi:ATP sulfurylase